MSAWQPITTNKTHELQEQINRSGVRPSDIDGIEGGLNPPYGSGIAYAVFARMDNVHSDYRVETYIYDAGKIADLLSKGSYAIIGFYAPNYVTMVYRSSDSDEINHVLQRVDD